MADQKSGQGSLFPDECWKNEWKDMPEFVQEDLTSYQKITVHFKSKEDVDTFAALLGQKISPKTKSIWYPPTQLRRRIHLRYVDEPET